MFDSPIAHTTIQSCVIQATSNIVAQFIRCYKADKPLVVVVLPVLQFMLYSFISSPPNFVWQQWLESTFPSHSRPPSSSEKSSKSAPVFSKSNTLIKFLLDQTLSAALNTLFFSLTFATYKGYTVNGAWQVAKGDFWPMMVAGWKFWPLVSAVNFGIVRSVEMRTLVGSLAGLCWGVYVSLMFG